MNMKIMASNVCVYITLFQAYRQLPAWPHDYTAAPRHTHWHPGLTASSTTLHKSLTVVRTGEYLHRQAAAATDAPPHTPSSHSALPAPLDVASAARLWKVYSFYIISTTLTSPPTVSQPASLQPVLPASKCAGTEGKRATINVWRWLMK